MLCLFRTKEANKGNLIDPKTRYSISAENPDESLKRMREQGATIKKLNSRELVRQPRKNIEKYGVNCKDKKKQKQILDALREAGNSATKLFPKEEDDPMRRLLEANLRLMKGYLDNDCKKSKGFKFDPIVLSFALVILSKVGRTTYDLLVKAFNLPTAVHVSLAGKIG